MPRLLVNAPTDEQQLINVGPGGGYFDPARVIWNENADGPLPDIQLGGMVRDGNTLIFDQDRMDLHNSAIAPPVPERVTRRQAKQAMRIAGITKANVEAAIEAIPNELARDLAMIEWQDALEFERNSPVIASLAPALGLDSAAVDALFVQAATL
jgi:hypothetical protein